MIETVQCVNYRHQTCMSQTACMYITFVKKERIIRKVILILPVLDYKCNQINIMNLVF